MTLWYFPKISQLRLAKHSWTEQRHRRWPQCSKHGFIALRGAGIEGQTPRKIGDVTWSWGHLRNNSSKGEAIHDYTVYTTTTMVFKLIWHNQTVSWCIMCIMGCRYRSVLCAYWCSSGFQARTFDLGPRGAVHGGAAVVWKWDEHPTIRLLVSTSFM